MASTARPAWVCAASGGRAEHPRRAFAELAGELRGEQRGELNGELKMLARSYERRLHRPLTDPERATLAQRMGTLGADRLLDVSHELSADALSAWLADPRGA